MSKTSQANVPGQTRQKLISAIERLLTGMPQNVMPGTTISAKSVAAEARVDRTTLYRFHKDILAIINGHLSHSKPDQEKVDTVEKRESSSGKLTEYKNLLREAQQQVAMLARHQYDLSNRIDELNNELARKDRIIAELTRRITELSVSSGVHALK